MKSIFTKNNFLKLHKEALKLQFKQLYPMNDIKDSERIKLLIFKHTRNISTFMTISYLVEQNRVTDIYTLSRAMFESIISMGLLAKQLIADDIERYQEYQYLEIYKTYTHLKRLGLERLSGVTEKEAEDVTAKRSNYIEKWGRSTSSWTGNSLESNVKEVDNIYPTTCNETHFYEYLYCQVYRKGSQSSHSSFGGIMKAFDIETVGRSVRIKPNEKHLIFSSFHALLVFLSSARFIGYLAGKCECEKYFQSVAEYIISEP